MLDTRSSIDLPSTRTNTFTEEAPFRWTISHPKRYALLILLCLFYTLLSLYLSSSVSLPFLLCLLYTLLSLYLFSSVSLLILLCLLHTLLSLYIFSSVSYKLFCLSSFALLLEIDVDFSSLFVPHLIFPSCIASACI